jgi:hypothetical protein
MVPYPLRNFHRFGVTLEERYFRSLHGFAEAQLGAGLSTGVRREFQQRTRNETTDRLVSRVQSYWVLATAHWPLIFYLFPLVGLKCMSKE